MPTFAYSGRTRAGQTVTGERVADTVDAAVAALRREQIMVTRIDAAKAAKVAKAAKPAAPKGGKSVPAKNLAIFTRQFSVMRGSFTGADGNRKGLIEIADKGTIFLDEIGEMSPVVQVKLLRVLQERKFRRLGGTEEIDADIRILAATNRDLTRMVAEGTFREDLFYRINVIPLRVPPLRERQEDVPLLAEHFVARFAEQMGKPVTGISGGALTLLKQYGWPGNIRELENAMERAVALERTPMILPDSLPEQLNRTPTDAPPPSPADAFPDAGFDLERHVQDIEREYIAEALRRAGGVKVKAAELLGMIQRVGIAQALLNDPEVIFLDEPMSGLDPLGRRDVRALILELRDQGRTVFFSSHILADAEALCRRVAVVAGGRLAAAGALSDILAFQVHGWELVVSGLSPEVLARVQPRVRRATEISVGRYSLELPLDQSPDRMLAELTAVGATLVSLNPIRDTLEDFFMGTAGCWTWNVFPRISDPTSRESVKRPRNSARS